MRRLVTALLTTSLLALVPACEQDQVTPSAGESITTTSTTTTTLPLVPTTPPDAPGCLSGEQPFQQEGNAGGSQRGDASDAVFVSRVEWEVEDGCERIRIEFATEEGAPAVEPPSLASFLIRSSGVLRVALGFEVQRSAIAEQLIETTLVDRVFIVRSLDGTLFADIHLAAPAFARVSAAAAPAAAVIDLQPGGPPYPGAPVRSGEVVVVEPVSGRVTYPFSINGYARSGAEQIAATVTGSGTSVTTNGGIGRQEDTWGSFVLLFPTGPSGVVSVEVGGQVSYELTLS